MPEAIKPPGHASLSVAIVGAGRLGSALAGALRDAGVEVEGPLGRGERPWGASAAPVGERVVLLCVPDAEIAAAAEALGAEAAPFDGRLLVGHVSGATPLSALAGAGGEAFGLHPLQTFAGGEGPDAFQGVGCAIAGATPESLAVARKLAERLGMTPIEISDSERTAYHAAASVSSNFLVTLQAAAEELAAAAGIVPADARALLAPLVRATVDNWAERGPEAALTGPVARGDHETVARQRGAVEAHAPHLLPLFDELVARTRELADPEGAAPRPASAAKAVAA
jgi:predicted short-subunit dehydrogenase-like oxidoreductase (DUF2520 family)